MIKVWPQTETPANLSYIYADAYSSALQNKLFVREILTQRYSTDR